MLNFMNDYSYTANKKIMDKVLSTMDESVIYAYDEDKYNKQLESVINGFGFECFRTIPTGTGANVFALNSIVSRVGSVICSSLAHIYTSENGGPFGYGIQPIVLEADENGKIYSDQVRNHIIMNQKNFIHPRLEVLSITQPTEKGAVYSIEELNEFRSLADEFGLKIHVDGARIFNALEYLNLDLKEFQDIIKADALFIGGGKAGLLMGELVAFNNVEEDYVRRVQKKLGLQLAKSWVVSAGFLALLDDNDNIWFEEAKMKNQTIEQLIPFLNGVDGLDVCIQDSYTNILYVNTNKKVKDIIQKHCLVSAYEISDDNYSVRFVSNPHSNVTTSALQALSDDLRK